jgi:cold shock CspA family protein
MSSNNETVETQALKLTGQVKWFNNKAGYGFITVNIGEHSGKDIFIHYSAIRVVNSQYKYLIQGEYVEFELVKSTSETHEYQAVNVSGINSGLLMCESRRNNNSSNNERQPPRKYRLQRNNNQQQSQKPNNMNDDRQKNNSENQDADFTVVKRRRSNVVRRHSSNE